jgi:hypothetical protein
VLGTTAGIVLTFDKSSHSQCGLTKHTSKEFQNNSITCIDSHIFKPGHIVVGHQRGQLDLIDLADNSASGHIKSLKQIKETHKGAPVTSVKFCDYKRTSKDKSWMIVSADTDGRVFVTKIYAMGLGILGSEKMTVIDPTRNPTRPFYPVIATRFFAARFPSPHEFNNSASLIALGSTADVLILCVMKEGSKIRLSLPRPQGYISESRDEVIPIQAQLPCIAWGYGRTPFFKDETYSLLAIAWGPVIQLVILNDIAAVDN